MLPHTGLFLLWKVALQMRIRRRLKIFRRPFVMSWTIWADYSWLMGSKPGQSSLFLELLAQNMPSLLR